MFDEFSGVFIGVGIEHVVGCLGYHLWPQHVVDERQSGLWVASVLEQHPVFRPDQGAFARQAVGNLAATVGLFINRLRRQGTIGPAYDRADVAVGQVGVDPGRVEIEHIGADFQQQRLGLLVILWIGTVAGQPQVVQGNGNDLAGGVEHGHATRLELADVFFFEDQVPAVHRGVIAQRRLDFIHVVANASGTPDIGHGVAIAWVIDRQQGEDVRVDVRKVTQLRAIQRLQHPSLDQAG